MIYAISRIVVCFLLSILASTLVIRVGLRHLRHKDTIQETVKAFPPSGFWIGFFETILVFVFVMEREYSGLAIIIAAKEFVRRTEIAKDPVYYLLGTLANIAIAILFALIARIWITRFLGIFLV
jgi:hypothetical protein